jgi:hypothetical protein
MATVFEDFINKLESLKDGEVLTTSFGAMNKFEAGKVTNVEVELCDTDKKFYIKKVKSSFFTFITKRSDIVTFNNAMGLDFLTSCERFQFWYAKNEFTGKLQFFDNYKAFLNAFKLKTV